MQLSTNGLEFLKQMEGFEPKVYKDSAGYDTIGYGHLIQPGESFIGGIDQARASRLLEIDVAIAVRAVSNAVKVTLTQNQFDALVSFTFNLGGQALRRSTLLRLLNSGNTNGAACQFQAWNKAGGKVVRGMTRRREAEKEMFLK